MKHKLFFALTALHTVYIIRDTTARAVQRYCKNSSLQETGNTERLICETEYEDEVEIHS